MSDPPTRSTLFVKTCMLMGNVCGRSYKLAAIDELFETFGANPAWRTKSTRLMWEKEKQNRVRQWMEGIEKFRPDLTFSIAREVLYAFIQSDSTIQYNDRLLAQNMLQQIERFLNPQSATVPPASVDPRVMNAGGEAYQKGQFTDAVRRAFVALVTEVKNKSEITNYDGIELMNRVFSPNQPILQLSPDRAEQEGCLSLFKGAVAAIRNPPSHSNEIVYDLNEANELLWFASYLFRVLDQTSKVL
jgi:uncharacterized protein (TIGR02391 family)